MRHLSFTPKKPTNKLVVLFLSFIFLFACSDDDKEEIILNSPTIEVLSPANNSSFTIGKMVSFKALVKDVEDAASQLRISISSDIQGELIHDLRITNDSLTYTTDELIEGIHNITFNVIDSDNMEGSDQVTINIDTPGPVILDPIVLLEDGLKLTWSKSIASNFESYTIMRAESLEGRYTTIENIFDVNRLTFKDETVEWGKEYFYKIGITLFDTFDVPESNIESEIFETEHIDIRTNIERIIADPVRPYFYALDRERERLLFINKHTLQLEKSIRAGMSPTDLDISLDNSKLYITLFDTDRIAVIDLDSQAKIHDLTIELDSNSFETPYRIVCLGEDKLAVAAQNQFVRMAFLEANNGERIWLSGKRYYKAFLLTSPDKRSVLVSETRSSGSVAYRLNLDADGYLSQEPVDQTDRHDWWHPQYGADYTVISGDGQFIFYCGKKIEYNDLKQVHGSFQDKIHASNYNGSVAVGAEHIWDATNYTMTRRLPFTNSGIMIVDDETDRVFIFHENSKKLYYFNIH